MARKKKVVVDGGEAPAEGLEVTAVPEEETGDAPEESAAPEAENAAIAPDESEENNADDAPADETTVEEGDDAVEETCAIPAGEAETAPVAETEETDENDAVSHGESENSGEETEETDDAEDEGAGADGEDEDSPDGEESALPLAAVVEAVLFAAREPLKLAQVARAVGKRTRQEAVKDAIGELNVHYLETGRAFEIAEISGRYQLMSRPEFAPHIMKIYPKRELAGEKEKTQRLTPAALDTLAIIAYKQPVTRAEIEHIRGVGCGPVLKALLERDSIRIAGKRLDMLGQPLVYGTTESFLAEFGLGSLDELPMRNDFLAILGEDIPPVEVLETNAGEAEADAGAENAQSSAVEGESVSEGGDRIDAVPGGDEDGTAAESSGEEGEDGMVDDADGEEDAPLEDDVDEDEIGDDDEDFDNVAEDEDDEDIEEGEEDDFDEDEEEE